MEDPTVMPTINNTPVIGCSNNARKGSNVEQELRKVYMEYVFSLGLLSLAFAVFYASAVAYCLRKHFIEPVSATLLEIFLIMWVVFSLLEITVNGYFVYLLDTGRGDVVRQWRKNTLAAFLLRADCDGYRKLKSIERRTDDAEEEEEKEEEDDGQTDPTPKSRQLDLV